MSKHTLHPQSRVSKFQKERAETIIHSNMTKAVNNVLILMNITIPCAKDKGRRDVVEACSLIKNFYGIRTPKIRWYEFLLKPFIKLSRFFIKSKSL